MGSLFGSYFDNPFGDLGDYLAANLMGNPFPAIGSLFGIGKDSGGRDTSGDVAFLTGQLLKSQYEDWEKTFKPIELQALNEISFNNATVLPTALDEAADTTRQSFKSMSGVLDRQNRAIGIQPTQQQAATSKRLLNLNEAAATASAKNTTRSNVRQMDDALLMGTTPNPNIAKARTGVTG